MAINDAIWCNLQEDTGKKGINPERVLSATYADLPAPDLKWEKMATAPVPRLDGAAIQINNLLYVFAGYGTIDYVRTLSTYASCCSAWFFSFSSDIFSAYLNYFSCFYRTSGAFNFPFL